MLKVPLFTALTHDEWVVPYFRQYKKAFALAIFLGFLTFFSAAALMFNSGLLISKSASLPINILLVYIPIVLTRAFGVGRPVFRYLERLTSHNWVLKVTSHLRLKLYLALEEQAVFVKQRYRLGDIMGLLSEDINHLQNLYLRTIFPTFIAWLLYVVIVIGLGFYSVFFALLMCLYFVIIVFVFPLYSVLANGYRQQQEKYLKNKLYVDLTDNVLGISDWIFSQRGEDYVSRHEQDEAQLQQIQRAMRRFNHRRTWLFEIVFGGLVVALLIWTSEQFKGSDAANWIAAFVLSVFPLMEAFSGLSTASQETNRYLDSIQRLNQLSSPSDSTGKSVTLNDPITLMVDHMTFQYSKTTIPVLKNITLKISPKEKVAILGRSGSGKSTLASLIRGDIVPTSGDIQLNNVSVHQLYASMSKYIGIIQQSPYLFNTTLINNIRIGNEEASETEVWDVLERVGLKQMVETLPDGLHTLVDEAGLRFSGGERHRIALARILLKNTPIVLLDEPTVGLDPVTEQNLLETLMHELDDKILIWITHHLKGIEYADKVIFIEDGQIEMIGSPQELMETSERYRQLVAADNGDDD